MTYGWFRVEDFVLCWLWWLTVATFSGVLVRSSVLAVWIEQEVTFLLVKLLGMSSMFCSCCFEKFSSSDISWNHQWQSPTLHLFQEAICLLHNSYLNFYFFNWFLFLSFYFLALSSCFIFLNSWNDNLEFGFDFCVLVSGLSLFLLWNESKGWLIILKKCFIF